jgi:hypothetical protein
MPAHQLLPIIAGLMSMVCCNQQKSALSLETRRCFFSGNNEGKTPETLLPF